MKKYSILILTFTFAFTISSCRTGKKAYQKGNYYQSVIQAVDKLRNNPNNKLSEQFYQEVTQNIRTFYHNY